MATLAIMNPSLRPTRRTRRKGTSMKKRRTAAQKAATRKLVALNRGRKANPAKRRRRSANPIVASTKRRYRRSRNPIGLMARRHHRRRSRNPISTSGIWAMLKEGSIGAAGALTVDLLMGVAPLPTNLVQRKNADGSVNYLYYATKAAAAIGVGMLGKKVFGRTAETMALGSMTVNLYDLFRSIMPSGIPLGYINAGYPAGKALGGASVSSRMMPGKAGAQRLNGGNLNAQSIYGQDRGKGMGMYTGHALSMYTNR